MNILFVCSANKLRSRTAEDHFSSKYPQHSFDSAGTNHKLCKKEGTTMLMEEHMEWADKVYVMEPKHLKEIKKHTGDKYAHKVIVLGIPDVYDYGERHLINLLINKVKI